MAFDFDMIKKVYQRLANPLDTTRKATKKPLTLAKKILHSHLLEEKITTAYIRVKDYLNFAPDRIACQDATTQIASMQFMQAGKNKVAILTNLPYSHLILTTNQRYY